MSRPARILALIGSGETSPSMARVHRGLLDRIGPRPVPAVLLDTPYGFQENAAELTARLSSYFADRVGNPIAVASFAGSGSDPAEHQVAMARVRDASFVFSGPGSPTYALRHWAGSDVPALLADKLATGGVLVMASAAALTLGRLTAPIYEVYKVGEDPRWLKGLDLLSAVGLPVAVIPHYDNAEGGTHDTRFCYLGARRLEVLEAQMPDDTFILGIDENTVLILDLEEGRARVLGKGGVTVRRHGRSTVFGTGTEPTIDELRLAAFQGEGPLRPTVEAPTRPAGSDRGAAGWTAAESERAFAAALHRGDLPAGAQAILSIADLVAGLDRSDDGLIATTRALLASMVVRLSDAAAASSATATESHDLVDALVAVLVDLRRTARSGGDWATADTIRARLRELGVEVHDADDETTWTARPRFPTLRRRRPS